MNQNVHRETILVVDDKPANIKLVQRALSKEYLVETAVSGKMALEMVEKSRPDLILLDIMMPEMDGYEVCRILKADETTQDIPVIFLTAITDMRNEAKGLTLGAVDYITKPINLTILMVRVKTHLALMAARMNLARQNEILQQEQELVENIVLRMRKDTQFSSEKMNYLNASLDRTSGDILLSLKTDDDVQYILMGDFTGHGLSAAIGGPLASSLFYVMGKGGFSLSAIAEKMNQELCAKLPVNIFMAAIFIERNMATGALKIWNCGMPDILHIRNGVVAERLPSENLALGIVELVDMEKKVEHLLLELGDHLVAYSDGVLETASEEGEMFGQERFEKSLKHIFQKEMPLESLMDTLTDFSGINGLSDDVTVIDLQA